MTNQLTPEELDPLRAPATGYVRKSLLPAVKISYTKKVAEA